MSHARIRPLAAALTLALPATITAGPAQAAADQPLTSAVFRATHNSYSGNVAGAKGSITQQLDGGVRFLEYDLHDNDYGSAGDYQIGHDGPGNEVDNTGGNPASNRLRDWLNEVNAWSAANPSHAPLVMMLDIKDNLTDNTSYANGNLAALNDELEAAFGARLLRAEDYREASTVDGLRGRVLPLLSGDGRTRTLYKRDSGAQPAVAIDALGNVVEVHKSEANDGLWYWTGKYGADGRITWLRHGRYDTGRNPSVALDGRGNVVEVHKSQNFDTLWYHVGRLDSSGEIDWSASHEYDDGVLPTIEFTDPAAGTLREIHRSENNDQNWEWKGKLNADAGTITWSGNAQTDDPRDDNSTDSSGDSRVHVYTGSDGPTPPETLRYETGAVKGQRIRYEQTAFTEFQEGNSAELKEGALFYGAPATSKQFIVDARGANRLARGWYFDDAGLATDPLANYPATDHPYADWYEGLLTDRGAVE